jgi:hypothetical protein
LDEQFKNIIEKLKAELGQTEAEAIQFPITKKDKE